MNIIKNKFTAFTFGFAGLLMSCSEDEPTPTVTIENPTSYDFNREGSSSVSFSGQTTRISMAEELISALTSTTNTIEQIDAMFDHEEGSEDFSDSDLNASDKNIKSKVAASTDYFAANTTEASAIKSDFDLWINNQVENVFPSWDIDASEGVAGGIQEAGGGSTRYVNAHGLEYNQAIAKSMIGALMTDQILNNYLSVAVLDEGTNREDQEAGTLLEGKNYTTMEHKWDEAYGYLYGASADYTDPNSTIGDDDSFLNKYLGRVNGDSDFEGISLEIFDAFKLGRAAIVAFDYTERDAQIAIIRQKISEVIAIRAIYYLQQGKAAIEAATPDMASAFHDLSEGYGFVYSLQFTRNPEGSSPFFNRSEVEEFIDTIYPTDEEANGFWDVTPENLQSVSETIASSFDFTVEQAGS